MLSFTIREVCPASLNYDPEAPTDNILTVDQILNVILHKEFLKN